MNLDEIEALMDRSDDDNWCEFQEAAPDIVCSLISRVRELEYRDVPTWVYEPADVTQCPYCKMNIVRKGDEK